MIREFSIEEKEVITDSIRKDIDLETLEFERLAMDDDTYHYEGCSEIEVPELVRVTVWLKVDAWKDREGHWNYFDIRDIEIWGGDMFNRETGEWDSLAAGKESDAWIDDMEVIFWKALEHYYKK